MKLTNLAIDGYGVCRDLRLGRFNDGLNLVFGETGAGKTTIRNFVRGVLYGFESPSPHAVPNLSPMSGGRLDVEHNNCDYRLVREIQIAGNLNLQPLTAIANQSIRDVGQLNGNLNPPLHDSIFSVGFHDVRTNYQALANNLHTHLGVPLGATAVRDEAAYLRWKQESESLNGQLAGIQQRIDSLGVEKRSYHDQIDQAKSLRAQKISSIDRQLGEISAQINSIETSSAQHRISNLKLKFTGCVRSFRKPKFRPFRP